MKNPQATRRFAGNAPVEFTTNEMAGSPAPEATMRPELVAPTAVFLTYCSGE